VNPEIVTKSAFNVVGMKYRGKPDLFPRGEKGLSSFEFVGRAPLPVRVAISLAAVRF